MDTRTQQPQRGAPETSNHGEFEERKSPELKQFTKAGDSVFGILREMNDTTIRGKPGVEYIIHGADGILWKVLQTYDLKTKLFRGDLNRKVVIEYVGEDREAGTQDNPMKIFKVRVSKTTVD